MNPTISEIKKTVARLRLEKNYSELGSVFWAPFITLPEGKKRTAVVTLWGGLTRAERRKCDS